MIQRMTETHTLHTPDVIQNTETQNRQRDERCHAGHSPSVHKQPPLQDDQGGTRDWFSLEDQISHKLAFLRERSGREASTSWATPLVTT